MLTSIDVYKFIFDSGRLGLFSSANILQIAHVALPVVFLLFLPSKQFSTSKTQIFPWEFFDSITRTHVLWI